MKRHIKVIIAMVLCTCIFLMLCGCSKVDKDYGVSQITEANETLSESSAIKTVVDPEYEYPAIMSDDATMPKFIDISLYDEENYADVYLGEEFTLNAIYDDKEIKLPSTYKEMAKQGWDFEKGSEYSANSLILAGKTVKVRLKNEDGHRLTAFFYNTSDSSVKLKKCNIVKIKIEENCLLEASKGNYALFNINGINNNMVMTDVIDTLGTPSHFYHEGENCYYLDYFVCKEDRRNGITVWVDVNNDAVTAIEFALYK